VQHLKDGVVNPLTTSGRILASAATGLPIVASHAPEWLAPHLLSPSGLFLTRNSLAAFLSNLFPVHIQTFYNSNLEPFFSERHAALASAEDALPYPLVLATVLSFDFALAGWFLGWIAVTTIGAVEIGAAILALLLLASTRRRFMSRSKA